MDWSERISPQVGARQAEQPSVMKDKHYGAFSVYARSEIVPLTGGRFLRSEPRYYHQAGKPVERTPENLYSTAGPSEFIEEAIERLHNQITGELMMLMRIKDVDVATFKLDTDVYAIVTALFEHLPRVQAKYRYTKREE